MGNKDHFLEACQNGPLENVNRFFFQKFLFLTFKKKFDINIAGEDGKTGLHLSASKGFKDIVELLLNNGADVSRRDQDGCTPLFFAIENNHRKIVDLLIAKGADINAKNKLGVSQLHKASIAGNKKMIELLLDHGADLHEKDNDGQTPLMLARDNNHKEIIDFLIDKTICAVRKTTDQLTLTDIAVNDENPTLQREALYRINNELSRSDVAKNAKSQEIRKEALEINATYKKGALDGQLREAVNGENAKFEQARDLLARGANPLSKDIIGTTVLHNASLFGHTDICELLLYYNADVNASDDSKETPLFMPAAYGLLNFFLS